MFEMNIKKDEFFFKTDGTLNEEVVKHIEELLSAYRHEAVYSISQCTQERMKCDVQEEVKIFERKDIYSRGRLPNLNAEQSKAKPAGEVIDLGSIKSPKSPEKFTYFRCPSCGQSVILRGSELTLARDFTGIKSVMYIVDKELEDFSAEGYKEYMDRIKEDDELTEAYITRSADEVYCPVCKNTHSLSEWIDAYEYPEKYFECSDPCPVCGTETCTVIQKDEEVIKCDNADCGYILSKEVKK